VLAVARPHDAPVPTHLPLMQQPAAHVEPSQHAWPAAPHAVTVPLLHTMPLVAFAAVPEAKQTVPVPQHAPPAHVVPPQQPWPTPPHATHAPFVHEPPPPHVEPLATHVEVPVSQHPVPVHELLAQHG
jgi:hypothetical protein